MIGLEEVLTRETPEGRSRSVWVRPLKRIERAPRKGLKRCVGPSCRSANITAEHIAAEVVKKRRREDPKLFLSNCRSQPEVYSRGLAAYKPLRDPFPVQMRIIDE